MCPQRGNPGETYRARAADRKRAVSDPRPSAAASNRRRQRPSQPSRPSSISQRMASVSLFIRFSNRKSSIRRHKAGRQRDGFPNRAIHHSRPCGNDYHRVHQHRNDAIAPCVRTHFAAMVRLHLRSADAAGRNGGCLPARPNPEQRTPTQNAPAPGSLTDHTPAHSAHRPL